MLNNKCIFSNVTNCFTIVLVPLLGQLLQYTVKLDKLERNKQLQTGLPLYSQSTETGSFVFTGMFS